MLLRHVNKHSNLHTSVTLISVGFPAADAIKLSSPIAQKARKEVGLIVDRRKCRQDLKDGVEEADEEKLKVCESAYVN